jgi:aryl-alcohol dehydrogenase-like predicted oxidoreductase
MDRRNLGEPGLSVSKMGLGCMGMSEFYGPGDEQESIATIHRALDAGIDFLDTADIYGPFKNERLVGKAIRGIRHRIVLATKFGNERREDGTWIGINGRPDYVRKACDASLQRLGVDHIDLYYQHRVDPHVPIEDTVGTMGDLIHQGKVRFLGLSEAGASTIRRAQATHSIAALQSEYSLWSRDVEDEILPTIRELGIGFVAYSPLGRGFLTGRFQKQEDVPEEDRRKQMPRFQGENLEKNQALFRHLSDLASEAGASPAQLALAWVLAQGTDIVPIFGTKRLTYLEDNIAAAGILLQPEFLARINEAFPKGSAAGMRYPEDAMRAVNR